MSSPPKYTHGEVFLAFLRRQSRLFLLSLGFLTRLVPARCATVEEMGAASLYYPFSGLVLGLVGTLPLFLGLRMLDPWLMAWAYTGISLWLTRSLHHDGLADLMDALGSGKTGEGFWTILKDSRIGAFGTVALIMALAGQIICASNCLQRGLLAPLVYAPLFARSLPIFLSLAAPVSPAASLGRLVAAAPTKICAAWSALALLAGGLLTMQGAAFICCLGLGALLVCYFAAKAREHGGYNGDFFGALIVCGEIVALFSAGLL